MSRAIDAFRGQRSVFTTRRHAAYPALTNAFSLGSTRGHRTDDFGPGIIGRLAGIERESTQHRQMTEQVRQAIAQVRTGIATASNRDRTLLDQGSAMANRHRDRVPEDRTSNEPGSMIYRLKSSREVGDASTTLDSIAATSRHESSSASPTWPCQAQGPTYAADIVSLRVQGHTYSAIREALEDAGVLVSISTVRREVLNGLSTAAGPKPAADVPAHQAGLTSRGKTPRPVPAPHPEPGVPSLPGKAIAEEFMRGRSTNTLYLKESSK